MKKKLIIKIARVVWITVGCCVALFVIGGLLLPEAESEAEVPATPAPTPVDDGPFEVFDPNCNSIVGRTQQDVTTARTFCELFKSDMIERVGARGVLLNLWVVKDLAYGLMNDQLQGKQTVLNLMKIWKDLTDSSSVVVTLYWGDVKLVVGDTTVMRGDVVTFEPE